MCIRLKPAVSTDWLNAQNKAIAAKYTDFIVSRKYILICLLLNSQYTLCVRICSKGWSIYTYKHTVMFDRFWYLKQIPLLILFGRYLLKSALKTLAYVQMEAIFNSSKYSSRIFFKNPSSPTSLWKLEDSVITLSSNYN